MMQSAVRNLQQVLKSNGLYTKKIDGRRGKNTDTAAKKFLASRQTELSEPSAGWTARRICIAAYQLILKDKKLPVGVVDGLWGSNTENAHEMFEETQEFGAPRFPRDIVINDTNPHGWPTYANITSVYGPHGV
ncbi:MAG: hypothetical protein GY947_18165, partial [Rhodobacteraceae bacterium]|nr:hypothetical protein [Paracoccaceae bacterium]